MTRRRATYFISDIHLGAACIADRGAQERLVARWLDEVVTPGAARLYLLGDVMDYWWEYRTVAPRGFTRFLGALARAADAGVEITWLKGNHDIWMRDYLAREIGFRLVDGLLDETIDGRRFVMEHGDGVGRRPVGFRMLRRLFRNPVAQALYGAVHPRWTIGLAHAWSARSRLASPDAPAAPRADEGADPVVAPLREFAEAYEEAAGGAVDYFVFGHVHRAADVALPRGGRMIVLGDWITRFTYAVFDGNELRLERYMLDNI